MKRPMLTPLFIVFFAISCSDGGFDDNAANTGKTETEDTGNTEDNRVCEHGTVRNCVDFDSFERCVDESWETISLTNEDLAWTCVVSDTKHYYDAINHCRSNGWHLPTITELRTIITNCPDTETGGACGVTGTCLNVDCWNYACDLCSEDDSGKYSVFGDTKWLWSASPQTDFIGYAWGVDFHKGSVDDENRTRNHYFRCVNGT